MRPTSPKLTISSLKGELRAGQIVVVDADGRLRAAEPDDPPSMIVGIAKSSTEVELHSATVGPVSIGEVLPNKNGDSFQSTAERVPPPSETPFLKGLAAIGKCEVESQTYDDSPASDRK